MAPIVERITDIPNLILGEGPHWDSTTQSLYFVDIYGKSVHKYVPSTGQHTSAQLESQTSIIIPVKGKQNKFITVTEKDVNITTWDGNTEKVTEMKKIAGLEEGTKNTLNDGKCDPKGRLWIGSMGAQLEGQQSFYLGKTGSLFSINSERISTTHLTEIQCSNGLAWNQELKQFYYIDTLKGTVDVFDYDIEKGTISNRRALFTVSKHVTEGFPDGMTIDKDGNLWVALFNGYGVIKVDPRTPETLLQKVEIPAKQVTSLTWGGKDLDELYITTGNLVLNNEELPPPNNGAVFKVTGLGTKGLPAEHYVL